MTDRIDYAIRYIPEHVCIDKGRLTLQAYKRRGRECAHSITMTDTETKKAVTYESIKEAVRVTGVSREAIRRALKKGAAVTGHWYIEEAKGEGENE